MDIITIEVGNVDVKFPYVADGVVIAGDDAVIELVQLGEIVTPEIVGYAIGPQGEPGIIHYTPEFEEARDEAVAAAEDAAASKAAAAESERQAGLSEAAAEQARAGAEQISTDAANAITVVNTARDATLQAKADVEAIFEGTEQARDDAIAAKDTAVTKAGEASTSAQTATAKAAEATGAATTATTARDDTVTAKGDIAADLTAANQAKNDAEGFKSTAVTAAGAAQTSAEAAGQALTDVETARDVAIGARDDALTARQDTLDARDATVTAKIDAVAASDAAIASRDRSETAAGIAEASAQTATDMKTAVEQLVDDIGGVDLNLFVQKNLNGSDFADPVAFRSNLDLQIALPTVSDADAGLGASDELSLWSPAKVRLNVSEFVTSYSAQRIHTHETADINGLDSYLASFVTKASNGSDFADPDQVRITIGAARNDSPAFTGTPTAPTPDQTDFSAALATTEYVQIAIGSLKTGAPELFDTLAEIGAWLDANDTELAEAISFKADKAETTAALAIRYTKTETDGLLATRYTKTETDTLLADKVNKAGAVMSGTLRTSGSFIAQDPNGFRAISGSNGFFVRTSADYTYFLVTDIGDAEGTYNTLRPLYIAHATGKLYTNHDFQVGGNASVTGTITTGGTITSGSDVTASSDRKLKKNLAKIEDALDKVEQLTGYTYDRVDMDLRQTGLIAQDVQKVLPEAVGENELGLTLAYGQLAGLFVEAIKELRQEIETLKAR